MVAKLLQGADAITEAAIAAGCQFFSGYPMLPFTDLLERMAARLPDVGGVCMNAASEIEAANMTLGAAAAGARAGTGSTGQGVALMQETVAEAAQAEIPFVVFTMARGQQDYFQCTRGGGWGDYRTVTLAPKDVVEAAEHAQLAFHLADKYRSPTVFYGDYLIADTNMSVEIERRDYGALPDKDWAIDGSGTGTGRSRVLWSWDIGKADNRGLMPDGQWKKVAEKYREIAEVEARHETYRADDAETLIVSWGTAGPFVDYVVDLLREEGIRVGSFRPITLWPFPERALEEAAARCDRVLVYEINAGQALEDVRLSIPDRNKIEFIGGVSVDYSGMRQGDLLDVAPLRDRILQAIPQGAT